MPSAVARAWHEAIDGRGPAVVIVPSDDWAAPADDAELAAPAVLRTVAAADPAVVDELADLLAGARAPALVVGADADDADTWAALVALAERLGARLAFAARAGFPQDHPLFAGHLPAGRARLREALAGHDVVLAVGAPVFRQYPYERGPLTEAGTTVVLVTDDVEDAHHSPVQLAVVAGPAAVCAALARRVPDRQRPRRSRRHRSAGAAPPADGEPLRAAHVMAVLGERLPADTVVVEETPSSRPDLHRLLPARTPFGFLSAAMGGLGFGLPAAIGVRMAEPAPPGRRRGRRRLSLYGIQALWSAAHYGSACCSSCWPTAATRSWTGSPSSTAARHPGRRSRRSASRRWPKGWAVRPTGSTPTTTCSRCSTTSCRPSATAPSRWCSRSRSCRIRASIRNRPDCAARRCSIAGNTSGAKRSVAKRVLAVLGSFSHEQTVQTLGEIQQAAGLPSATAHRIVSELVEWGALERVSWGRYRVGMRLWQLGSLAPQARDLRDVALPFLQDLLDVTHEVVHLVVLDEGKALFIERLMAHPEVHTRSRVARRLPLHATGPGKVLLAFSPPDVIEQVIAAGLSRMARNTITDPDRLRRALDTICRSDYCLSQDEMTDGASSVAVRSAVRPVP